MLTPVLPLSPKCASRRDYVASAGDMRRTGECQAVVPPIAASSLAASCARKLGSSEADVNSSEGLSSYLLKIAYVIRDSLSQASYGLCS